MNNYFVKIAGLKGYIYSLPVDTGDDVRVRARSVIVQHSNGNNVGVLSNTICLASNGASNMGAMPVAVDVGAVNEVDAIGALEEIHVFTINSGI
jgi:hypothetical protein